MIKPTVHEWILALDSGEYEKEVRRLRSDNGFCCLGVLADMCDSEAWILAISNTYLYHWNGRTSYLDPKLFVADPENLPTTPIHHIELSSALAFLNDNSETFEPIIEFLKNGEYPNV